MKSVIVVTFLWANTLCVYAQSWEVTPWKGNSAFNEFAPVIFNHGLVYCSDRSEQFGAVWLDANQKNPSQLFFYNSASSAAEDQMLLSKNVANHCNTGPACFSADGLTMYFTGTIVSPTKKQEPRLGIFISHWENNAWSEPFAFPLNDFCFSCNMAHPALSADGLSLYFVSDLESATGDFDVYVSTNTNGSWSDPTNLGSGVNSTSNELFPHITADGKLYVASDRAGTLGGFDLYSATEISKKHWSELTQLDAPINSEFNDFSICLQADGQSGYFTSDRNGSDDDIFQFKLKTPDFEDCPFSEKPELCYLIEDENIKPNPNLPLRYEWSLGDGTTKKGLSVEHCYQSPGNYFVALSIWDTLTNLLYARVSETEIIIDENDLPYILADDSLFINQPIVFRSDLNHIRDFVADKYYWNFSDGIKSEGAQTERIFSVPGMYKLRLGITSVSDSGAVQKKCVSKEILVSDPEEIFTQTPVSSEWENNLSVSLHNEPAMLTTADSALYFVEFKQSDERLPLTDPYFEKVSAEITERFSKEEEMYRYSVGHANRIDDLYNLYRDMMNSGYNGSLVRQESPNDFTSEVLKVGWYSEDSLVTAINRHLHKFSNIQFGNDNAHIEPESLSNLDYLAAVMQLEESFSLRIEAHTDSSGTAEHNIVLSNKRAMAVWQYLVSRGVNAKRLSTDGKGESEPIASNNNPLGRAINRRVEFKIEGLE